MGAFAILTFLVLALLAMWKKSAGFAMAAAVLFFVSNAFLLQVVPTNLMRVSKVADDEVRVVDERFRFERIMTVIYPFWESRHIVVLCETPVQCADISWNPFFFGGTRIGKGRSVERSSRSGVYDAIHDRWHESGHLVDRYAYALSSCKWLQCATDRKFSLFLLNLDYMAALAYQ